MHTNERPCRDRINDKERLGEAVFVGKQEEMRFCVPKERLAWGAPMIYSQSQERRQRIWAQMNAGAHIKGGALGTSAVNSQWNRRQGHQVRVECSCWGFEESQHGGQECSRHLFPTILYLIFNLSWHSMTKTWRIKASFITYSTASLVPVVPFPSWIMAVISSWYLAFTPGLSMVHQEK